MVVRVGVVGYLGGVCVGKTYAHQLLPPSHHRTLRATFDDRKRCVRARSSSSRWPVREVRYVFGEGGMGGRVVGISSFSGGRRAF